MSSIHITVQGTLLLDSVVSFHQIGDRGMVLVSFSLVLTGDAHVVMIGAQTMCPTVVRHGGANFDGGIQRCGGSDGDIGKVGGWQGCFGSIVGTMKSSGLCSEEMQAFFVGCGEVIVEIVQSPFIKWAFLPVANGICEDSSFF